MERKRLIQTIRYTCFFNARRRADYIRKRKIFGYVGKNVRLPLMLIPFRSENIILHNNIEIASGVKLIPHDAIHSVFNGMPDQTHRYKEHIGKIEIMDNVFVGAGSIILGPCKIGPNVIVGAGALVSGNVPAGSVVGGVPAKIIGSFDGLRKKRY